jgi:bifunctional DNase/RNase
MILRILAAALISALLLTTPFDSSAEKAVSGDDLVPVEVAALLLGEEGRSILLLLKPVQSKLPGGAKENKLVLPLLIGLEEGRSIGVAFHKIQVPRPLSHDLMRDIIREYGGSVASCTITKMENEIFFAELRLRRGNKDFALDSRPSDAIALALRSNAPIFVRRAVLLEQGVDPNNPSRIERAPKT